MKSRVDEPVEARHVGQRHLDRLIMLSDGIFAIAITLSAIEIHPEIKSGQSLWQAWSMPLLVYLVSFVLISGIWYFHRRMVAHLRDIDGIGTAINLVLLGLVALMPVVVRFVIIDAGNSIDTFALYSLAIAVTYSCMAILWLHVAFIAQLAPDLEPGIAKILLLELIGVPLIMSAMVFYQLHIRSVALILALAAAALFLIRKKMSHVHKRNSSQG